MPLQSFGWSGVRPLVGGWNGDGLDAVGVYSAGSWLLDYDGDSLWSPSGGDCQFALGGWAGSEPVVGDWNGDGRDKAGVFSNRVWFRDVDGDGVWNPATTDPVVEWGGAGDAPVAAHW